MMAINNNDSSLLENPSLKKKKRKVEIEEDDGFERLGDEVIVEILVRVNDEKSLRRCLAVNKRMSCLVKLADPVYIRIQPDPWSSSARYYGNFVLHNNVKFDGVCLRRGGPEKFSCNTCISHLPKSTPPPSLDHIMSYYINTASEYLRSVPVGKPIHHVTVILPPIEDTVFGYNHQWAWNLEYSGSSNGGRLIKSCCALFADFSSKFRADNNIVIDYQIQLITRCMRLAVILRPMVEWMVREYDTLCQVTIVTECGYTRLHIGPEEILKMKNKSKSKKNNIIISNNNNGLFKMKLDMKMFHYGTTFLIVTDPETHHNTQDVKTLIRDLLDRPHLHYNHNIAKNINKMRTRLIKHKSTLPPCILQIPNSNWEWNCEI